MWQLLNLLFLACAGVVGLVFFVALWSPIALLVTWRRRKRVKAVALLLGPPMYVALVIAFLLYQWQPAQVFENAIGFAPPADVTRLESDFWTLGDSGHAYLRFRCTPATAQRIVAARGMAPTKSIGTQSNDPRGWSPPLLAPLAQIYTVEAVNRTFASESELFIYDPATGDAYYRWTGID